MPKICLFDASGYLFRAYHALPPLTTSSGQQVNAVYGFARMVTKILKTEKPDYVGVCFDTGGPTFRHAEFEDYKANRAEPDPAIVEQFPLALELTESWGLPVLKSDGFEADDVIATVAKKSSEKGWDVLIFSGDKDLLQLVNDRIRVRDEIRKTEFDAKTVCEKFGVTPAQIVDFFCLVGDSIDNVAGVPGIGKTTAAKILKDNPTLEDLFKSMKGVKPALKEKLPGYRDKVMKNRRLIALRSDVPLNSSIESLQAGRPDPKRFPALLRKLGFRGEFWGLEGRAEESGLKRNDGRTVRIVHTDKQLSELEAALSAAARIAYDVETDDLNSRHCGIVGVALSVRNGEAWYVPVGHASVAGGKQLSWRQVMPVLKTALEKPAVVKIGQNLKFDDTVLSRFGITPVPPQFDTMIAAYCLEPERSGYGLKTLAADILRERMTRFEELVPGKKGGSIADIPLDRVADYAGADAEVTFRLAERFDKKLKDENVWSLFENLEMPLVRILRNMENTGIAVDQDHLQNLGKTYQEQLKKIESEIHQLAGEPFNLHSPKQLSRILFEKLKLPVVKRTKTGYSTNEDVLLKLAPHHEICEKILTYREIAKLNSTYVEALKNLRDPADGRIHTSFHQTGTSTGRLSSSDPNLQNIPIRTEQGREIRRAFVASPGCVLVSADYSQIDLRSLAHMTEDPVLVKLFQEGGDVHAKTAAEIFGVGPSDVTKEMRRRAKAINFGIVYGQQAWGLSQSLGISVEEAQAFINQYFERYAGVKAWIEKTVRFAKENGYVTTIAGRKRFIRGLDSENGSERGFAERIAINTPIQGTSADIIKAAMIRLYGRLEDQNMASKILVQIHDELLVDVPSNEFDRAVPVIKTAMEGAYELNVPLKVDVQHGPNWNDMEPS